MSRFIHFDHQGNVIEQYELDDRPAPLDPTGALAALLAATEVLNVEDAANAVGLEPTDLVAEVEAWAAAESGLTAG